CAQGASQGRTRLYEDGRYPTADGRAVFAAPAWRPVAEPRDARYPVSLTTGRLRDQWHGMSRSGTLGRLFGQAPEPSVDLHPQEMARRGWAEGSLVHVTSRRGSIVLPVRAAPEVAPAQAFIAMHWGEEFASGKAAAGARLAGVNALMPSASCPQSRQPELKHAAVKLLKAELPWQLVAAAWLPQEHALSVQLRLREGMRNFAYAHCVPFGREGSDAGVAGAPTAPIPSTGRIGLQLRAADHGPPDAAQLALIEQLLGIEGQDVLRYADVRRSQRRSMRLAAPGATLDAFLLSGDAAAAGWVLKLLQGGLPARPYGQALLSGRAAPPTAMAARTPQVCNCFDVSESQIVDTLRQCEGSAEGRLAMLQQRLKCGTQCGSCLPALRAQVAASGLAHAAPAGAHVLLATALS
ncbi:MAG: molybdopterin dinucleotide binding domain-containing protein, partial [Rubrivivax sp.]